MLKKRVRVLLSSAVLVLVIAVSAARVESERIRPEKKIRAHKIVRIHYISGLDPVTVTIQQGTTVIWMNDSRSLAEIYFTDKQVVNACKSPTHFTINVDGAFVSDKIPDGAVASLCFIEKGEFEYLVRRLARQTDPTITKPDLIAGRIIVQ